MSSAPARGSWSNPASGSLRRCSCRWPKGGLLPCQGPWQPQETWTEDACLRSGRSSGKPRRNGRNARKRRLDCATSEHRSKLRSTASAREPARRLRGIRRPCKRQKRTLVPDDRLTQTQLKAERVASDGHPHRPVHRLPPCLSCLNRSPQRPSPGLLLGPVTLRRRRHMTPPTPPPCPNGSCACCCSKRRA